MNRLGVKWFETPSEVVSVGIEILDGVIENLSKECDEPWFKPLVKGRVGEFVTVGHLDVAFEKRLKRTV